MLLLLAQLARYPMEAGDPIEAATCENCLQPMPSPNARPPVEPVFPLVHEPIRPRFRAAVGVSAIDDLQLICESLLICYALADQSAEKVHRKRT